MVIRLIYIAMLRYLEFQKSLKS